MLRCEQNKLSVRWFRCCRSELWRTSALPASLLQERRKKSLSLLHPLSSRISRNSRGSSVFETQCLMIICSWFQSLELSNYHRILQVHLKLSGSLCSCCSLLFFMMLQVQVLSWCISSMPETSHATVSLPSDDLLCRYTRLSFQELLCGHELMQCWMLHSRGFGFAAFSLWESYTVTVLSHCASSL